MKLITDILREIRNGRVVEVASEKLAEVTRAVMETGKAGDVTLKISVKPNGKGDNAVIVSVKLTHKTPQGDLPDAIFFSDEDGSLLRNDPTQQRMFADAKIDRETGEVLTA